MPTQHRQPLASKTNTNASETNEPDSKGKGKDPSNASKTTTHPSEDKAPTSKDKGKGKAKTDSSTRKENAPGSLDRLFSIDISRALSALAPTRYDPYYRFPGQPNKPPAYAPYDSGVLEELARVGFTAYSLDLSEDSRCWRLNELMKDRELMRKFMKNPKGWTVRLGPRGQEIDYNVEDIIAARTGMEPTYSSSSNEDFTPNPCDTPRPSTPYCARDREYLKATLDWAGMYDRLEDQEETLAKARSDRSRSTTPSSSSSSTIKNGQTSRATSFDTGPSDAGKKEPVVWKTAFEDDLSKEELGRQLDEQAAQAKLNERDDDESDSESDEDEYGSSKSLFRAIPKSESKDEEEPEVPRNSVFRAWNDVDSDDDDQVDEDGEEDSDDDISECDIEPDPSSPSTLSTPCGNNLSSSESPSETSQASTAMETEKGVERELEKEMEGEKETETEQGTTTGSEMEGEKEKEYQQEKVVPTPYVRPNARSFLQMFFRPPVPPTPTIENDDQGKKKEEDQIPTATGQTSSLCHEQEEPAKEDVDHNPDSNESSMIHSADLRESDEEGDDYEEGEKETPDTSLDSCSDAETDEKGPHTRHHPLSRTLEEDGDNEDERDEDGDGDEKGEGGDGDEHHDKHNDRNDDSDKGGNDGRNCNNNEDNDDDQEGGIDADTNQDDKNILKDRTHTRDQDDSDVNSRADTRDYSDNDLQAPYDPYAGMSYEEIMSDPRDLGPDWDIHLSEEYKVAHPNPKYNATPLDWWTEKLDDEWSVAVEWYQGGPDPDPRNIEWACPMAHDGRRYRLIEYIEPTEYGRYTQEEADATFCYGQWDYELHARWLEEKLVDLERWRKYQLKINLMINWRVRTGQQPPLCEGWWFMNEGQSWWETDSVRGKRPWMYPYG